MDTGGPRDSSCLALDKNKNTFVTYKDPAYALNLLTHVTPDQRQCRHQTQVDRRLPLIVIKQHQGPSQANTAASPNEVIPNQQSSNVREGN